MINTNEVLQEIEEAFYDIPFENSAFQNTTFVLAAALTPGRAYRALGLRMSAKLRAIEELNFSRQREQVDIDQWQSKIDDPDTNEFTKRRCQINIDQKLSGRNYTNKLLNDAIQELNVLYAEWKKYPAYTREQFEAEELQHFTLSLQRQIEAGKTVPAAMGALMSMNDINHTETFTQLIEEARHALSIQGPTE
jgi:hypothetical protein